MDNRWIIAFEKGGRVFFPPTHFWYLGLMRSVKAILFTCVGYRGRYWIQSLLCFKEQILQNRKKQPPPCYPPFIILKGRILWSKPVRDFFYCLHTKLPVGSFSTQTSYHKCHGNKVNKTTSVGQSQEGVVFLGVWDKTMPGHLFSQVYGCCLRAAAGENKREQRMLLSMDPSPFPGLPAVLGQWLWLL